VIVRELEVLVADAVGSDRGREAGGVEFLCRRLRSLARTSVMPSSRRSCASDPNASMPVESMWATDSASKTNRGRLGGRGSPRVDVPGRSVRWRKEPVVESVDHDAGVMRAERCSETST
jgi:hypothetical protein